jgi:SAM-dependent methyltransferase
MRRFPSRSSDAQPALSYVKTDAQEIALPDNSFDFVISTENLEHLPRPEDNIAEIRRLLRPDGLVIVATPNEEASSPGLDKPTNPWHIKEFTFEELRDLLLEYFGDVRIFESSLPSRSRIGRSMKEDRVRRGAVGLDGTVGGHYRRGRPQGRPDASQQHTTVRGVGIAAALGRRTTATGVALRDATPAEQPGAAEPLQ